MKSMKFLFLATAILVFGLVTTGCPSPVGGGSSASVSINANRAKDVFAVSSRAISGSYLAEYFVDQNDVNTTPIALDTKYSGLTAGSTVTPTNFGMSFALLELWSTDGSFLKFGEGSNYYNDFAVQNPWYSPQAIDPGKTFYCLQMQVSAKYGTTSDFGANTAIKVASGSLPNGTTQDDLLRLVPGLYHDHYVKMIGSEPTNELVPGLDIYIADTLANAEKARKRTIAITPTTNPAICIAVGGGMTFTTEAGKTIVVTLNWDVANILRNYGGTTYLDQGWCNKITATHN